MTFLIPPLFDFILQLTDYNYIISNREVFCLFITAKAKLNPQSNWGFSNTRTSSIAGREPLRYALYRIFWSEVCNRTPQRQNNAKLAKGLDLMQIWRSDGR